MQSMKDRMRFFEQIRPFAGGDDRYGRMYGDLHDLVEASEWLIKKFAEMERRGPLSKDDLIEFLIDVETHFIEHASFHISTLRNDLRKAVSALEK